MYYRFSPFIAVPKQIIRVGHSPDSDDAFMFYALAKGKLDAGPYEFVHELVDIETLNRRAFHGELELTAVSVHAYAYLNDVYALCNCGASMGDQYGPILVETADGRRQTAAEKMRIAIPGELTTAFLTLKLYLAQEGRTNVEFIKVPFDQIQDEVKAGKYDTGLIIHEGQLTYEQEGLKLIADMGVWWKEQTGLPLPLGANAIRRDLPSQTISDVVRLLHASIKYALDHREEALDYALQFGRGLRRSDADKFVGMYVNDWTLDFGDVGRRAVRELLQRAYDHGIVPKRVVPEFI
ncbi:MAG: ABC transporter substrate-binding protein [Planctomycetaceae bacterium]|nr:ABC transporter substrate-binding protein [Planctomycetaceae bacterium]